MALGEIKAIADDAARSLFGRVVVVRLLSRSSSRYSGECGRELVKAHQLISPMSAIPTPELDITANSFVTRCVTRPVSKPPPSMPTRRRLDQGRAVNRSSVLHRQRLCKKAEGRTRMSFFAVHKMVSCSPD
ncbi:hypothetical protein [Shinella sp. G-2]|uniref:hypothetical protein n=1 Tax=Shinella sp. G-2 TaxID=3133141 RepID=UPI003D04A1CB